MRKATKRRAGLAAIGAVSLAFSTLFVGQLGAMADSGSYTHFQDEQSIVLTPGANTYGAKDTTTSFHTKGSISGMAMLQRWGNFVVNQNTTNPRPIPMQGLRIYAQWKEADGAVSPIYTTVTNADGSYSLGMNDFTFGGKTYTFNAEPSIGEKNDQTRGEKYRIWAEADGLDQFNPMYTPGNAAFFPQSSAQDTTAGMNILPKIDEIRDAYFKFSERIDNSVMHLDNPSPNAPDSRLGGRVVVDKVFWNFTALNGALTWGNWINNFNSGDIPAANIPVYASYLNDAAVEKINKQFPGVRGLGWTAEKEAEVQNWIQKQISIDGKEAWIAETAVATTGLDGKATIQFKGTYGNSWENCGVDASIDKTDPAKNDKRNPACHLNEDGTQKYFHKLADSPTDGTWSQSSPALASKHINSKWMFVSTELVPHAGSTNPFSMNYWSDPQWLTEEGMGTTAGWDTLNTAELSADDNLKGLNMALYPGNLGFDVTPYGLDDANAARIGDVAHTEAYNVPTKFVDNVRYTIIWTNDKGEEVGRCSGLEPTATGTLPTCDFTVPEITAETIFNASLYAQDRDSNALSSVPLASDSFRALPKKPDSDGDGVPDDKDLCGDTPEGASVDADGCTMAQRYVPSYTETKARVAFPATSEAPLFDDVTTTDVVEKIPYNKLTQNKGTAEETTGTATFAVSMADTTVAAEGAVTTTPKNEGRNEVPVKVTYPDKTVDDAIAPFIATDGDEDGDGVPDSKDKCPNTLAGSEVDENGCSVAPTFGADNFSVNGVVGSMITDVVIPVNNPGNATIVDCKSTTLPDYATVAWDGAKKACVISGTRVLAKEDIVTDLAASVELVYDLADDVPDAGNLSATVNGLVNVTDEPDGDGDGVPDSKDKCPNTPTGATVDANGCSVAPTVTAPNVNGKVGIAINPVTVDIVNPGKADITGCTVTGLPAGLSAAWNGTACVISGTPEGAVTGTYIVTVTYNPADDTPDAGNLSKTDDGSYVITDPDDDNDTVPNSKDKCPNTPAGAVVDENGCSVAPTVTAPDVKGEKGDKVEITVPIANPGKTTIVSCSAEGL
ncbi:MAG: thrombospondin type 3 repeat-containing protein, partial [Mobiluncus porci]|uniref:thrombospondin type 3 repeat-containing protein n=1 Tax=Mobiluncus porci TaxID=2652278 RepID=UPI0023F3C911